MLRFNRSNRRPPNYLSQREQLRALRLVIALGLVLLLINVIRSPRAVEMLGIFFGGQQQAEQDGAPRDAVDRVELRRPQQAAPVPRDASPPPAAAARGLADVRDNAPFRGEESEPWYHLLGVLHDADHQSLAAGSVGELTALQLLEQPDVYRGRLINVRGTARQVITPDPLVARLTPPSLLRVYFHPLVELPAFALRTAVTETFLRDYRRVVVQQPGAAVPIIVFTLGVPEGFPQGESVSEPVSVSGGYFFKNWLFAADDGIGVAPVVLAKTVEWHPAPPPAPPQPPETADIALAITAAVLFAIGVTWWLIRRSRKLSHPSAARPATTGPPPDFSALKSSHFATGQHAD